LKSKRKVSGRSKVSRMLVKSKRKVRGRNKVSRTLGKITTHVPAAKPRLMKSKVKGKSKVCGLRRR
jgi:hypothetical protein